MWDDISNWFSDLYSNSWLDNMFSDYSPTSYSNLPSTAALGNSSLFSGDNLSSMLYGGPSISSSSFGLGPVSFDDASSLDWLLTPQASQAGGIYGTGALDFLDLGALINSPLTQTDLWSVNPFDQSNDSWLSTGWDNLNPALEQIDNLAKFRSGLSSFEDASARQNTAYDFLAEELGLPRPSTLPVNQRAAAVEKLANQAAKSQAAQSSKSGSKASNALQSALKAAGMAGTLYKLATADNGLSAEDVARRDNIRDLGPSFAAARLARAARGYKKGGSILSDGPHGGLLQIAAQIAEMLSEDVPGGQDDVVEIVAAPGEYVWDADTVAAIGDGDNDAGAKKLDKMRMRIRAHKRSAPVDDIPPRAKPLEQYLGE